jgi:hypothetical protein
VETANGKAIFPAEKSGSVPGTAGGVSVPGAPRTNAVAPASDAGIARKSASVNWPLGGDDAAVGKLGGDAPPGAPGNAYTSFTDGTSGGTVAGKAWFASGRCGDKLGAAGGTRLEPAPKSISVGGEIAAVLSGDSGLRGSAAKNSLASLAIKAGSGGIVAANGFSYFCTPSSAGTDVDPAAATRSLVFMVLVDIDVLQHTDRVLS